MAELTVRQGELVVTMEPREKRSFTRFGLRKSRSRLLDGLELRVSLAEVAGVRVSDSYWELRGQMDARNARGAGLRRGAYQTYQPPETEPWVGIYNVKEDGGWQKRLCVIHGQHSPVIVVDLDAASKAPFAKLVITVLPWQSDSVAASIKAAAGLT
jgi:hypothetical protein